MPSSSYYYNQYKSYKNQVISYDKHIRSLTNIKNSLTWDFYDEQSNVNRELDELHEDLNKSVRHDSKFSSIASGCNLYKEKSTTADDNLNNAVIALENEINSLNNQKSSAEQNRDSNYQDYQTKKEEERQAWLDYLNNLL